MEEKLLYNLKNWYRAGMIEKCSINKTWLIKYNWVRSYIRLIDILELMHNKKEIDVQI